MAGLQGDGGHDDYSTPRNSEAEEESVYSEEELGGLEEAEDEWLHNPLGVAFACTPCYL